MDMESLRPRVIAHGMRLGLRREDAEDVAQQAFIRAFRAKGDEPVENPLAYLLTSVANMVTDLARGKHGKVSIVSLDAFDAAALIPAPVPEAPVVSEDAKRLFYAVLSLIPKHQAEVIRLSAQGLTYEQIADRMQIKVGTVRSRMHRGKIEFQDRRAALRN